jgi:hypothetical protein
MMLFERQIVRYGQRRHFAVNEACRAMCASSRSIEGLWTAHQLALGLRPHDRSATINVTNEMLPIADSSLKNCLVKYRMLYRMSFSFCEPRPNASLKVIMPSSAWVPPLSPDFFISIQRHATDPVQHSHQSLFLERILS